MPLMARRILPLLFVALAACGGSGNDAPPAPPPNPPEPPPATPGVPIPPGQVEHAIGQIDQLAADIMARTGIPGMAIAVVHDGKVAYARGFGVRETGKAGPIDADTVFQLASLSKPIGATVVARQISQGAVRWDTPMLEALPGFALGDAWVTQHLTVGDLYAHRSGLPLHAGDDLEDLGYDRDQVLQRLRLLPLTPFRSQYAYTNFGITAAAEAVARRSGNDWVTLSEQALYQPLGMTRTSSRFADFMARDNRAVPHVLTNAGYQPRYQRDPDAQSPAGGVSSSVNDLARWMQLLLAEGEWRGQPWILPTALVPAMTPQMISSHPRAPNERAGSYGYGFNVSVQPSGRTLIGHSGAFLLGAGTNFALLPSVGIGIVALTNAQPRGAAEAMAQNFLDLVQFGHITRDWVPAYAGAMAGMYTPLGQFAGQQPPAHPAPPAPPEHYVGTYANDYFGALEVQLDAGQLWLQAGPAAIRWPLRHWDGDTFVFDLEGENAPEGSVSAAWFERASGGASAVRVEWMDQYGLGTFRR
ncbi:MAG: serine hydrolase [Pigmentiphaga sp.]